MFTFGLDSVAFDQVHDSSRGRASETRQADGKTAYVDRMEAVHVLTEIDGIGNFLLVDVLRQRQLDYESVHVGILVEFFYLVEKLLLGDVVIESQQ